ncbi:MAG: DNA primase [Blastocatellia bacterium]|nr:DNA primase [Blastocatellia bacterium]MDW8169065.1 DNA primase [Acidobacteriota bacterium]MDW8256425.1 DNA primase [Acidobacteriota bacterium]
MTPREFAERVREQTDIVRIISDYIALRKRGSNYMALCPFHRERTPSFAVHPVKQIFKCFGCGQGGDVFAFVMRMEGCSWWEAVRLVAEKQGIPIPSFAEREGASDRQARIEWQRRLAQINAWACEFFERCLREPRGEAARAYLTARGVSSEAIRRFRLGYAPESWTTLSEYLLARQVTREELERSGLVTLREDRRGFYDRFRHRLIFPIRDVHGRIVGFGGRALGTEEPKYVNSPETALYAKGRHLFGLFEARDAIRHVGQAILVEGYFDWLALFEHGIENVVATLGTALTDEQVRLLRRYAERVVLNFDADTAGRQAMSRNLEKLLHGGLEVSIVSLPEGEDPDSFVRRFGAAAYRERVAAAAHYLDFLLNEALRGASFPLSPSVQARALKMVLPYIAAISDAIERAASADRVAGRLGMESALVREAVKRYRRTLSGSDRSEDPLERISTGVAHEVTESERLLLEVLLHAPDDVRAQILAELEPDDVRGLVSERIFDALRVLHPIDVSYAALAEQFAEDPVALDLLERILVTEVSGTSGELLERARGSLRGLRRRRLERELFALQAEIEQLPPGEEERLKELLRRKCEVAAALAKPGG